MSKISASVSPMSTFGNLTNLGGGIGLGIFSTTEVEVASGFIGAAFAGFIGAAFAGFSMGAGFAGFSMGAGFILMLLTVVLPCCFSQADTLSKTTNSNREVFTSIV
ncbi:MAG: hypothetical protein VYB39_02870 [Pseudomonadota bacterium]|nr:hypothetical protein [Pseudomonadota bacterium]